MDLLFLACSFPSCLFLPPSFLPPSCPDTSGRLAGSPPPTPTLRTLHPCFLPKLPLSVSQPRTHTATSSPTPPLNDMCRHPLPASCPLSIVPSLASITSPYLPVFVQAAESQKSQMNDAGHDAIFNLHFFSFDAFITILFVSY